MAKAKKTAKAEEDVYIPQTEQADKAKASKAAGGDTVTVALCDPQGITFLLDEGRRRVTLNGNAVNLRGKEQGILPVGGFGLTTLKRSDWEDVHSAYFGMVEAFIKKGLLIVSEKKDNVLAECDEKAEVRHGLEPIAVEGKDKATKTDAVDMSAI